MAASDGLADTVQKELPGCADCGGTALDVEDRDQSRRSAVWMQRNSAQFLADFRKLQMRILRNGRDARLFGMALG